MNFTDPKDSTLTVTHFFDANSLESTDSKRFVGFRTSAGEFKLIDIENKNLVKKEQFTAAENASQLNSKAGEVTYNDPSQINFIHGGNFVGYVKNDRLHVIDLKANHDVMLPSLGTGIDLSDPDFILERMSISPDERFRPSC